MGNMEDYLKWRGDITFDMDPFNEVDNLILSELSYVDFGGIVGSGRDDEISLLDVCDKFFELHTEEEIMDSIMSIKIAPFLMKPMVESERFKRTRVCAYVNEIDNDTQIQFSAVTFLLPDDTYYVAYRGTDSSIIGWKEDFNMSYLYMTPGQRRAVEYLDEHFGSSKKSLRIGGHSKGGNFAVFASAFCQESVQKRIMNVYTNDGPGFRDEVLEAEGYNRILPKIVSTVPEQTLIGMIQGNKLHHRYVKSSNKGIMQHDAISWQVIGNHFLYVERSDEAEITDQALSAWLSEIPDEKREKFVDILFDTLMAGGANTTDDFVTGGIKNMNEVIKRIRELDEEDQRFMRDIVSRLRESYEARAYEHMASSAKNRLKETLNRLAAEKSE